MNLSEAILARTDLLAAEDASHFAHVGQVPGLCIGFVPGVMPDKWFNRWKERYGALAPLTEVALDEAKGLAALDAFADMVIVRADDEPAAGDRQKYHAIELYREQLVVIMPQDHLLTVLDEVPVEDLAEEFLLQNPAEVPEWEAASAAFRAVNPRHLPEMQHRKDAVELVAAGVGLLVAPLSVARFYHRKDLTHRPVIGLGERPVLLCWKRETRESERETVFQDFIGITRGRTATSNRGSDSKEVALEKQRREKEKAKRQRQASNRRREQEDRKKRNARKNGNLRQRQGQKKTAKGAGKTTRKA
ncbi:MAG: LysR family transcriptional regulator substrate-binding protein [Rothia sp. (in: high G+C Gram-positive bacteria)]|nr:LysR family transcriptional regulator substrate-binding protein [Rothia sp. (in: high G+C Gram-positive bacteria)]